MADELNPKDWITTKEAAKLTGYSVEYVRRLVRQRRVAAKKWLRDWVVSKQSLMEYQKTMEELGRRKFNPWKPGGREKE